MFIIIISRFEVDFNIITKPALPNFSEVFYTILIAKFALPTESHTDEE